MSRVESVAELNGRWWYRLVKVLYVLGFLGVFLLGLLAIYLSPSGSVDYQKSVIHCDNGSSSNLAQLQGSIGTPSYSQLESVAFGFVSDTQDTGLGKLTTTLHTFCADTPSATQQQIPNYPGMPPVAHFSLPGAENFTLSISTREFTLGQASHALVWLILLIVLFEVFRRVFYYIVLGKFYPKNH